MTVPDISIRDANSSDFDVILHLNQKFVELLSPLNYESLTKISGEATYFRVALLGGQIAGFLIAFEAGANYSSPNYRWFDNRYKNFAYIDRIVIAEWAQGKALAPKLYDNLATFARAGGAACLTCEYNIKPMNEGSAKFHNRYGFKEVGQQVIGDEKLVSLQVCDLA